MKKTIAVAVFLFVVAVNLWAPEVIMDNVFGLNEYIMRLANKNRTSRPGTVYVDAKYYQDRDSDIYKQAAALEYREDLADCTLELALAIQYTGAVKIRPVEAAELLPEGHTSDVKLTAGTYARLQVIKFLDPQNSERIGRYELMIRTLKQRNNVTQAEIDTGIRSLISEAVDEEFNKIDVNLYKHNAYLIRNPQTGQYILSYGGVNTNGETRTVKGDTLEALSSAMRNGDNKNDFTPADFNSVQAQARLIPAVALSDAALNEVKTILTNFYITPNATTYACVRETHTVWDSIGLSTGNIKYVEVRPGYERILNTLNEGLYKKVFADVRTTSTVTTLTKEQQARLTTLRQ